MFGRHHLRALSKSFSSAAIIFLEVGLPFVQVLLQLHHVPAGLGASDFVMHKVETLFTAWANRNNDPAPGVKSISGLDVIELLLLLGVAG